MSKFQRYLLGDIAEILTGPFGSLLHEEDYVSIGTPIVTVEHLGETGFIQKNLPLVGDDDKKRLSKYILKEGDIVFSRVGSIDRCTYVSRNEEGWLFSGRCLRLRISETANAKFISYYFRQRFFKAMMLNISVGATMPSLNTSLMANIPLSLPNLGDQEKIASILSSLDAKIELNNRINAELEAMAKTLYDYWFVQFDFPNEQGKPYKTSGGKMVWNEELKREIPEGWKAGNLLSLSDLEGGGTPSKTNNEYWNGNIPFYTPTDYSNSVFTTTTQVSITKDGLDNCSTSLFPKGTIFITARGTVGNVIIASTETAMNQSCYAFCPKLNVDYSFLYFSVKSLVTILKAKSGGSVFNSIVSNDIKQAKLAIPPILLVQKFAKISRPIFEEILANTIQNQYLSSLRDWLLPMLINGQVTVGEAKKAIYQAEEDIRVAAEPREKYTKIEKPILIPSDQQDQRFEIWLNMRGIAARGEIDTKTLRAIFNAIDEDD